MVLDHLADVWHAGDWRRDGEARIADANVGGTRVRLLRPTTYMNLSGQVLRPYVRREGWSGAKDLLVVLDDVALPLGHYRLRGQGSSGGHNGLKSIEAALGTQEYSRMRVGIKPVESQREVGDLSDFVLSRFGKTERATFDELLHKLTDAIEIWLRDGIIAAMNAHNRKIKPDAGEPNDM